MIVLGADGLEGEVSTPLQIPGRLFSQGVIIQRGLNGRLSQSITFVENGDMRISAEAMTAPKVNDVVGEYTAYSAYIYTKPDDKKEISRRVANVLASCNELYHERFRNANGFDANGKDAKAIDVMIETVPAVGRDELVIYVDRNDVVIETDLLFKNRQDDELQQLITNEMQGFKGVPELKQIGYGLLREGWTKMVRPNKYIRVGPKTVLVAQRTKNEFIKSMWQVQAFYMYTLGTALKDWLGKSFPALELEDWVAHANVMVSWLSGVGDTDRDQNWDTNDIQVSMNHVPGLGWTKANRYLWGNVKTSEDFKMYWMVCNLLGLVSQRVKGAESVFKVKTVLSTNDWLVPKRFARAMEPNIPSWGSDGTHFFMMPRNNFGYGDKVDVPILCIVDDKTSITDQAELLKTANNYEDLLPYEQTSWKDVTIDRGEVPKGAIDPTSMNAQFVRLHATNDARIVEYTDSSTRYIRRLIQWRFPIDHIVNNEIDRETRLRLFFWGIFANGERGMKNAYVIESSLDLFKPMLVNYRRIRYDAMATDKAGTSTVGDQISKPGTIPYSPNVVSTTESVKSVDPPKPIPKSPDPKRIVDLRGGGEAADDTVVEESSKHSDTSSDASNNVPENGKSS